MNIDLLQISYKIALIILAFLAAVVVTKTVSKYFKLDEKLKNEEDKEYVGGDCYRSNIISLARSIHLLTSYLYPHPK